MNCSTGEKQCDWERKKDKNTEIQTSLKKFHQPNVQANRKYISRHSHIFKDNQEHYKLL